MSSFASVLLASSLQSSVQYNDEEGSSADEVSGLANTADLNGLGEKVFNRLFDVQDSVVMQAHGFYSKGTLKDASNFELEGAGFIKILRPRDRGYATVDLIHVISTASAQLHSDFSRWRTIADRRCCRSFRRPACSPRQSSKWTRFGRRLF